MDLLWAMVPLSFLLLSIAIAVFFWAVRHGQFDDMDSPAHRILFDDDEDIRKPAPPATNTPSETKPATKPGDQPHD